MQVNRALKVVFFHKLDLVTVLTRSFLCHCENLGVVWHEKVDFNQLKDLESAKLEAIVNKLTVDWLALKLD